MIKKEYIEKDKIHGLEIEQRVAIKTESKQKKKNNKKRFKEKRV